MDTLPIELNHVSFSRCGAYLVITARDEAQCAMNPHLGLRPGLWLRNFHDEGRRDVFCIEPIVDGQPVAYEHELSPGELRLTHAAGVVRFCLSDMETLRIRCEGLGVRLSMLAGLSTGEFPMGGGVWRINASGTLREYTLCPLQGRLSVQRMTEAKPRLVAAEWTPDPAGVAEGVLIQCKGQPELPARWPDYEAEREAAAASYEQFRRTHAAVPEAMQGAADLAAYINWSSFLSPQGQIRRPAMLMSKNWMGNVWSWDHCFTAMGLAEQDPSAAWDQFMCIFDHQLANGQLPDMINDTTLQYNHVKPPIHGWTYRWMMRANAWFTAPARLAEAYERLAKWSAWWFAHRDPRNEGLPEYHHGNDSGWDNGTVFDIGQPTQGPDLAAFLALQMDMLGDLADRLGRGGAGEQWRARSRALVEAMIDKLWIGDRFVTRHAHTGEYNDKARSIINCMPLMVADRLPAEVREATLARLRENLTDWGLATEHPESPLYNADGYWRGPIWASPTLLLIDGLREMGEVEFAETVAERFRTMCLKSGFSENYNAVTGEPLRDQSYTWASSVFLILARELGAAGSADAAGPIASKARGGS